LHGHWLNDRANIISPKLESGDANNCIKMIYWKRTTHRQWNEWCSHSSGGVGGERGRRIHRGRVPKVTEPPCLDHYSRRQPRVASRVSVSHWLATVVARRTAHGC